ncbi:calcyphosin [Trypanosoma conorhini]|uniref:Calcyphosin n=1 Tax=Trypanosoma conorhini TaxID=83891 RepID=A0A422PW04_9TRYP|nr:calcyphosin [Trypanosoma conorhini]RNF21893.1 calcyphosin [Trypanosoma conorhini]
MEALVAKAVERLGRKKLWLVARAMRRMDAADYTVAGVRDALRRIRLYLDDDDFAEIAAQFARNDGASFDVAAFVRALLATLPPRRAYAVGLVLRKVDPESTGFVSFETLREVYDVMRHPLALTRRDASELVDEFLAAFEEAQAEGGVTTDELAAYYVGISHTTPQDEDFELRCIRSFSLDRPRPRLDEEPTASLAERKRGRATGHCDAGKHPLYETTSMQYGKDCEKVKYNGKYALSHCFTKYAPMQHAGGATSMNM